MALGQVLASHNPNEENPAMSVTHPNATFAPASQRSFADRYPQLSPLLVAAAIVVVSITVALAFTGLPA
jgi:hypothetical protein